KSRARPSRRGKKFTCVRRAASVARRLSAHHTASSALRVALKAARYQQAHESTSLGIEEERVELVQAELSTQPPKKVAYLLGCELAAQTLRHLRLDEIRFP